jgi:repressor LexA
MKELTPQQSKVLGFITDTMRRMGMPPTIREIADHFGYKSINNVRQHLSLIAKKGYIRLMRGKARGIEVVAEKVRTALDGSAIDVPLVGVVPAGSPVTAAENIDSYITLDKSLFRGDDLFTLRVKGDSMEGAGICSGDIAVVRQQRNAANNDIVVALIDDDATLKRFFRRNGQVILHAENPKYENIVLGSDRQVSIIGKLVGVIRKY